MTLCSLNRRFSINILDSCFPVFPAGQGLSWRRGWPEPFWAVRGTAPESLLRLNPHILAAARNIGRYCFLRHGIPFGTCVASRPFTRGRTILEPMASPADRHRAGIGTEWPRRTAQPTASPSYQYTPRISRQKAGNQQLNSVKHIPQVKTPWGSSVSPERKPPGAAFTAQDAG